ncbi:MAG: helicase-related protein [candidate division WOR-3 bacterium]
MDFDNKFEKLEEGKIVRGPFWKEPIEINKIEKRGGRVRIIGVTVNSREYIDQILSQEDIKKIEIYELPLDFSLNGEEAFLAIEATRFRFASLFDPLLAMNVSKIDPLPFQIDAVYGYVLKLPRIRFLIADDPGAGKTIMAGLIIKELKLRKIAKRILIVVPGHLKDQWRREMKEKFQEVFWVVDRNTFNSLYGENPWEMGNQIITSMDFAKQEDILPSLNSTEWDLVVVDEAHKLAAYRYGEKIEKTERYRLGEVLSKTTNHMLFLTATPHKGDPENYRLFLDLLAPGFFANQKLVKESIENKDNPLFIRRLKEDLRDFEGKPIFTNRYPKTIKYRLSDDEKRLYNELSKYVVFQYNKALEIDKKRNVAFALLILQRRLASSVYALLKSLQRRKERLEELLEKSEIKVELPGEIDFQEIEDYEEERRLIEEEKWETLTVAENREELEKEIATIERLIEMAEQIIKEEKEVKLNELKKALAEGFKKIEEMNGNKKILIFTESRDTLEYLTTKIKGWGYLVNYIHGGMKLEKRIEAEKIFQQKTEVMVSTEAGGEGINLQFCHLMINYDIPWNPNRLEQRMGRIHRYGQQKDVYIFNLVTEDTREGLVLSKLFDKLEEIRKALGNDKVFDVIGDIFYQKNLYQLILDAVSNARTLDDIIRDLDIKIDEEYIRKIKDEILGESLATKYIDYTRIKEMAEKAKEYRLIPEYVEEFFKKGFQKLNGEFRKRKDGFIEIESIPYELKKITEREDFKNRYGGVLRRYSKITFDKDIAYKNPDAEFVSFGHPLLEALIEWASNEYFIQLQKGSFFEDPSGRLDGIIWFYISEIKDGKNEIAGRRIISIYDNGKKLEEINPAILWDLIPKTSNNERIEIGDRKEKVEEYIFSVIENYKKEIQKERERQAEIKKKYGLKSLDYLITELDTEILELEERKSEIENLNEEKKGKIVGEIKKRIEEKRKKKIIYEDAKKSLEKEIEQEMSLTLSMPKFLTAIRVKPKISEEMVSDEEIERIGMEIAMEYERKNGREPEDVSKENLGFDIRSKDKEGKIRYIEVKARKDEGEIALTLNEWFKAKRFKEDYWLYVIFNAIKNPTLWMINNPAENLEVKEKVEIVRFTVSLAEIKNKFEKGGTK